VWWGDERFVAAGSPERNEGQAQEALLGSLPLPEENIHRMGAAGEFPTAEDAAVAYSREIAAHGVPRWDVVLCGMGPDAHVASLFPGHPVFTSAVSGGQPQHDALAVHDSPKPPPTRVTLSLAAINRAREVWIVAAGAEKAQAVADALRGEESLPAASIHGTERTLWLLDTAAATRI
jgi:6-phosphogluconolactonase